MKHQVIPEGTWATAVDRLVWALGIAAAEVIVDWMGREGQVVGDWRCRNCRVPMQFHTRPSTCGVCGNGEWDYEEIQFRSGVSGISGSIDMLWRNPTGKLRIIEIKSIKQDQFVALKGPIAEHRLRTNLYMRCVEESKQDWKNAVDTQKALVL